MSCLCAYLLDKPDALSQANHNSHIFMDTITITIKEWGEEVMNLEQLLEQHYECIMYFKKNSQVMYKVHSDECKFKNPQTKGANFV